MSPDYIVHLVMLGLLATVLVVAIVVGGWFYNTRQKIRHGYPLESMWGKPLLPQSPGEDQARITLLTQENARLGAEVHALKDRLVTIERIVTDSGYGLSHEIENLRVPSKRQ